MMIQCRVKPLNASRPRERQVVTIIAGFRCDEGVVICADSQETIKTAKRGVAKIRYEPCDPGGTDLHFNNLGVAFCGAGDGPFIDKLAQEAWNACKGERNLADVCSVIEQSIKDTYKEFGQIYQAGYCPEVHLIYGAKMGGQSRLFSAFGPVVNEKDEYETGGIGQIMAEFLATKLHRSWLGVRQAVILAAYILLKASENVDGCGGDPQIIALRNNGASGEVDHTKLFELTRMIDGGEWNAGHILLAACDLDQEDEAIQKEISVELESLFHSRAHFRARDQSHYSEALYKKLDSLGLPVRDESKKLKGKT
jgi:hypothetical protein